jgi:DNA repair photolyase
MPQRANHVLSLIRQMRGGALNDATFGQRFVGTGPYAELLSQRFDRATRRLGLNTRHTEIDVSQFRVPDAQMAMAEAQMSLF